MTVLKSCMIRSRRYSSINGSFCTMVIPGLTTKLTLCTTNEYSRCRRGSNSRVACQNIVINLNLRIKCSMCLLLVALENQNDSTSLIFM